MRRYRVWHLLLLVALLGTAVGAAIAIWITPQPVERAAADYYDSLPSVNYTGPVTHIEAEDDAVGMLVPAADGVVPITLDLQDTRAVWYRALQASASVHFAVCCPRDPHPGISIFLRGDNMVVHAGTQQTPHDRSYAAAILHAVQRINEVAQSPVRQISFRRDLLVSERDSDGRFTNVQAEELGAMAVERAPQLHEQAPFVYLTFLAGRNEEEFLLVGRRSAGEDASGEDHQQVAENLLKQMLEVPMTDGERVGWPVAPGTELKGVEADPESGVISVSFSKVWWEESDEWTESALDCLLLTLGQISDFTHLRLQADRHSEKLRLVSERVPGSSNRRDDEVLLNPISREIMSRFADEGHIRMSAVGDVALARGVRRIMDEEGEDYPFAGVKQLFADDDLTFINLESPLSRSGERIPGKMIWFRGDPESIPALRRAGVDVINLANNHILDYGRPALVETIEGLREWGYLPLGVGMDKQEAHLPLYWEGRGFRIAFLGYTEFADIFWDWGQRETFAAGPDLPGVAALEPKLMKRDVRQTHQQADAVVVSVHWGEEYVPHPSEEHANLAHKLVQEGAAAIIGHHPHVLQSIDVHQQRPILYSLGNFIFDQQPLPRRQTVVAQIDWSRRGGRVAAEEITFVPCLIRDGQPTLVRGEDAEAIIERLTRLSGERGTELIRDDGRLLLPLADH